MENKLTNEQIEKAKTSKTAGEVKAIVEKEPVELTDEGLKEIAGGSNIFNPTPARTGLSGPTTGFTGVGAVNGTSKGK